MANCLISKQSFIYENASDYNETVNTHMHACMYAHMYAHKVEA